ncbi:MAG: phosphatase PAP2 family protein [Tannerella sp.]|jgi:hypothetical protein|nr:phosphatase PAP2 family protein [Tannerella sp.]
MKRAGILFILTAATTLNATGRKDVSDIKNESYALSVPEDSLKTFRTDTSALKLPDSSFDNGKYPEINSPAFSGKSREKKDGFTQAPYIRFVIPAAMISYGLIAQENGRLQALDRNTHQKVSAHFNNRFPLDDYLQYAPYAAYYTLEFCGVKARHQLRDRTIVLVSSLAVMGITVRTMKKTFDVERPDRRSKESFPSGHTATAFLGAHLLYREYKDASPWIAVAGYISATTVGALRVRNKRHWVSDVVTGAGIGIASVEAGYMLLSVFRNMFHAKNGNKDLVITPVMENKNCGIGLTYTF